MSEVEFEELWQEFICQEFKDGGYENVRQVQRYVRGLSDHKRSAFLDEIVSVALNHIEGWGIALAVLETEAMPRQIQAVCEQVKLLNGDKKSEDDRVWFLRVLASDPAGKCLAPVEDYLPKRKIGPYWTSLPWALWPHHPELFCRAEVRFFTTCPSKEWRHSIIPQAFLSRADALALLKSKLREESESAWQELRSVLWEQRDAPWLNEEQKKSLLEVLVS